jgi:hypothetical protein
MKVTKNISRGDRITSLDFLMTLAKEKKSVVVFVGGNHFVRPAAFLANWSMSLLVRLHIFHAVKIVDTNEA